jgi:septal ring factor EnvC (AmiA/AmiB activator)
MEAKIDALIREVSALTEQTKQLKNENIEIRSQIAEMKSRLSHEQEDAEEEEEEQETGFLCFRSKPKKNVAPPGRTTHPTRNSVDDDAALGAPGATTHPSRGNKKPLPVFKPKNTELAATSDSKPEYSQV